MLQYFCVFVRFLYIFSHFPRISKNAKNTSGIGEQNYPHSTWGPAFETRLNLDFGVTAMANLYLSFSVWRLTQNRSNQRVFQLDANDFYFWTGYKILILRWDLLPFSLISTVFLLCSKKVCFSLWLALDFWHVFRSSRPLWGRDRFLDRPSS